MRRIWAIAASCLVIAACHLSGEHPANAPVEIAALAWVDGSTDAVTHLTTQPESCLKTPNDPAVQRGDLLFNSPLLLGGQAAKAELSCGACHRNGRGNPDFEFNGISGAPGTADVTHGLFSKVRADTVFNPVPIPDLARAEGRRLVDRDQDGELEAFLAAQIVEEFSGETPQRQVINDLAAYIRAIDEATCDPAATIDQSWEDEIKRMRAGAAIHNQEGTAYRAAMRAALGRLHDRYPGKEFDDLRSRLVTLSRGLSGSYSVPDLDSRLAELEQALSRGVQGSLYDPEVLSRALR